VGIEPTFSAWEADVLPLNYTRERARIIADRFKNAIRIYILGSNLVQCELSRAILFMKDD
jgi:hypothetical protein